MSDRKLLQAILNGQAEIRKAQKENFEELKKEIVTNRKRIDNMGGQVAFLEDDAPTNEEFTKLEKRVGKLEKEVFTH